MLLFSLPFMFLGSKFWVPIFWMLVIFIGLPTYLFLLIDFFASKFIVDENKITINSGILVKRSKSIAFNKVQNIENVKGILRQMFGLSTVRIWTSSASQINVRKAMRLLNLNTGLMVCKVCGSEHYASIKPDSGGRYYRGVWQCLNGCNSKSQKQA
jgi:uncharacterized membrane protein YdbT with pleckstrin-like domain